MAATELRDSLRRGLFDGATVDLYALTSELGTTPPLAEDSRAEADPITSWPLGVSEMQASAEENWFGSGADIAVVTARTDSGGSQYATDDSGKTFYRGWRQQGINDWSGWVDYVPTSAFNAHTHAYTDITDKPSTFAPSAHASTHTNGTDDIQNATSSQKGLATAAQITKLDGVETGATADQTPTEIRAALKYATDAKTNSAAITSYDEGITIMPISSAWDSGEFGEGGEVVTFRNGSAGFQQAFLESGWEEHRYYAFGAWQSWLQYTEGAQLFLPPLSTDVLAESAAITSFDNGVTITPVSAGANWGPNAGEAGHVITERNGSTGEQTFVVPSTATSYVRYYTGGAWGSWIEELNKTRGDALYVGTSDARLPSARAVQTIGAAGAIAVGNDEIIPVTATADRTGVTLDAAGYSQQIINIVNRSAFSLTFNATEATSRVVGGGTIAPNARAQLVWDADYGGSGVGRWVRLPVDAAASIASLRTLGTGAGQAAAGNDSRLSDTRIPTDSSVTNAKVDAAAAIAESKLNLASDAAAGTASRRTLGTGATQAAPGNDSRFARHDMLRFFEGGEVTADRTGVGRDPMMDAGAITDIRVTASVAPTGATLTIAVLKNGVSQTTLNLTAGNTSASATGLNITCAAGDYITVNLTRGGGMTVNPQDIVVKARYVY